MAERSVTLPDMSASTSVLRTAFSIVVITTPSNEKGGGVTPPPGSNRLLETDRMAAAAGPGGVGVLDDEPRALQVLDVIDPGAVQVLGALGVDKDLHVARAVDLVAFALLVEGETVGE